MSDFTLPSEYPSTDDEALELLVGTDARETAIGFTLYFFFRKHFNLSPRWATDKAFEYLIARDDFLDSFPPGYLDTLRL